MNGTADAFAGAGQAKVEEKLFQNRYLVDAGRPHIQITSKARPSKALIAMTHMCPAGCYALADRGQVELSADGCMECGTCRIMTAKTGEIEWHYPRGGFGILYKFG